MLNVAGSANDPIFFNHHTMIDCLFEQWMEKHNMSSYPSIEVNPQFAGHGYNDCLVPFIPLYTNADMFMRSTEFGYKCSAAENTLFRLYGCIVSDAGVPDNSVHLVISYIHSD